MYNKFSLLIVSSEHGVFLAYTQLTTLGPRNLRAVVKVNWLVKQFNGSQCCTFLLTLKFVMITSGLSVPCHVVKSDRTPVGGAGGSPAVPQLAKAVQCLSLNRTALLQEPGYNCVKLLDSFADVYTGLVGCFLENSHPTCMCEACLPFYREVHKIYHAIQTYDSEQNSTARYYVAGHRCTENLLYGSKLGVLQSALAFAENLWQTAACECKETEEPPAMYVGAGR